MSGALLLLTGKDAKANAAAERQLAKFVDDVNERGIILRSAPTNPSTRAEKKAKEKLPLTRHSYKFRRKTLKRCNHQISSLKVSRADARERWLVRMLLAVEPDLKDKEFEDKAMVFAVYGRGRVLPPFIGKGINRDNLIECVKFVTGPCACAVKAKNPGVDLLIRCDWTRAAADKNEKLP